jgi:hypothetical protein
VEGSKAYLEVVGVDCEIEVAVFAGLSPNERCDTPTAGDPVTHSSIIQGIEDLDDFGKEHLATIEPRTRLRITGYRSPACARGPRQMRAAPWVLTAGRFPVDPAVLQGGVLILETSEELVPAREFGWILRSLGERGLLAAVDAVLVARPPTSSFEVRPSPQERAARRAAQRDVTIETVQRYNPGAVVVVGVPFGHTRPQWILPYGGSVTVDGAEQRLWADYS